MSLKISEQTEAFLTEEARRQGISVDALLQRLVKESGINTCAPLSETPELPILRLGPMGPLHRRDIYDDVQFSRYSPNGGDRVQFDITPYQKVGKPFATDPTQ